MYGLYGFSNALQSAYRLAAPFHDGPPIKTVNDLRPAYLDFVGRRYPQYRINRALDPFVRDGAQATALLRAFGESSLNDLEQENMTSGQYEAAKLETLITQAQDALDELQRRSEEWSALFHLVMHSIVISPARRSDQGMTAHGGTSSHLPGMMWLTVRPGLSQQDQQELFVHELTHTLMFLDELNHGHFHYAHMGERAYWATSSILTRPRPMDKVVHSIAVATEVLHARSTFLANIDAPKVHQESGTLAHNTLAAVESVLTHPGVHEICRPRAIEIAEHCREHILRLQAKGFPSCKATIATSSLSHHALSSNG